MVRLHSDYVEVGPYRLHYLEAGHGPLVVLIPSMLVMARSYAPLIRRLASEFHVVVPEMPGSGFSSPISRPHSFEAYAEIAQAFVDALGLGPGIWMGHSNSGPVVLHLARRFPESVRQAVVVDTIGAYSDDSVPKVLLRRSLDAVLEPRLTLRGAPHVLWNLVRHCRSFLWQVRAATQWSLARVAGEVRPPLLFAWGTRDQTEPPRCAFRARSHFPHSQLALGRGSHDWLIESSREFSGVFRDFVALPR